MALLLSMYLSYRVKAFLSIALIANRAAAASLSQYNDLPALPNTRALVYQALRPTTPSFGNQYGYRNMTMISYFQIIEHAENFISEDMLLLTLVLLVGLLLIVLYRRLCNNKNRIGSNIWLEIGNGTRSIRINWQSVNFPAETYTLRLTDEARANIQICDRLLFARIFLMANSPALFNKQLHVESRVKSSKLVSRPKWQAMKIRNIISEEYYVALIMASSGSSEMSMAVIRALDPAGGLSRT
jgi:hypothetical protein